MKLLKALAHPIIIGILCIPLIKIPEFVPQFVLFAIFACWAMYFFLGANLKAALWGAVCFIIGEIAGIMIIVQAGATPFFGSWALMIAVGVWAAILVLIAEQIKPLGALPAYFQAAALYFGTFFFWWPAMKDQPWFTSGGDFIMPFVYLTMSMAFGFFMGWVTILIYGWWGNFSNKLEAPAAK